MNVLGVMSGTSVDAIDVALAGLDLDDATGTLTLTPRGHLELPWPEPLRAALLAAGTGGAGVDAAGSRGVDGAGPGHGTGAPADVARGAEAWCRLHAEAGRALGAACAAALRGLGPADLIACHGQTLHHLVSGGEVTGTLQIGAPAYVHAATGLPVVSDLRAADVAAGGQGAPLASTLDALWLGGTPTAVLNLGGIANVTLVGLPGGVVAGDTGPANCLLDAAAAALGRRYDAGGELAAAGRVDAAALERLLADPYYVRRLPKSTGREHFHAGYVASVLGPAAPGAPVPTGPDLFATLTELTARTVTAAIRAAAVDGIDGRGTALPTDADGPIGVARIVASGGGVRNPVLLARLAELAGVPVLTSDDLGLPAEAKEAYLMALLGWLSVHGLPGVITGPRGPVTGARHAAVLGSLTPPYVSGGLAAALRMPRPHTVPRRLVVGGTPDSPASRPDAGPGTPDPPIGAVDLAWSTEQRLPASAAIDTLDTGGVVGVILDADAAVAAAVRAVAPDVARAADLVVAAVRAGGVVHYVGSGTSGRMGVLDAVELLPTYHVGPESFRAHLAGGAEAMVRAAEGAEDDADGGAALAATFGPHDLVVGIAASGRTPYVRGALEGARRRGLATVLVSANPAAPLAALADVAVLPDTGPEVITGSTRMKAATAQKMVLNAVSTAAMVRLGKTYGNLMIEMVPTNAKLRARSIRMLAQGSGRPEPQCAAALAAAGGDVRTALVALLAGLDAERAGDERVRRALAAAPPDPARAGDPSGVRAAVAALGGTS